MDTVLNRVVKEHQKLLSMDREPDALYLNGATRIALASQAEASLGIQRIAAMIEFLGMTIYTSEEYRDHSFRIYCKPQTLGEF